MDTMVYRPGPDRERCQSSEAHKFAFVTIEDGMVIFSQCKRRVSSIRPTGTVEEEELPPNSKVHEMIPF